LEEGAGRQGQRVTTFRKAARDGKVDRHRPRKQINDEACGLYRLLGSRRPKRV
jgi:hypothetical protein